MASTVPWPAGQSSKQQQPQQRRAFGDVHARAENFNAMNAANAGKGSSLSTDKSNPSKLGPSKGNSTNKAGDSVVAKFGAMYGGTTKNNNASGGTHVIDKENIANGKENSTGMTDKSSSVSNGTKSRPASNLRGSAATDIGTSNPVTSPKFQSLRDAFQKRSETASDAGGSTFSAPPALSDGFNKMMNKSNANRRASRESRSQSRPNPRPKSRSRSGIEVYDENIDPAGSSPSSAAAEQKTARNNVKKNMKQEVKAKHNKTVQTTKPSSPFGNNLRSTSTSSVASDGSATSEIESVRLRLQNKELKSENGSLRASIAKADTAASDSNKSNSVQVNRLKAELHATRSELDCLKGAAGQGEMFGKLRKNLEMQADKLQDQLDAEKKKSRSLERQVDEMKASLSTGGNGSAARAAFAAAASKEKELEEELLASMANNAAMAEQITKLRADLKTTNSAAKRANSDNQNDEVASLRKAFTDFQKLHSDCDVKTAKLSEQETKLKISEQQLREADNEIRVLEDSLSNLRNQMVLLQNESTRHLEKNIKVKEQQAMHQWSEGKKREAALKAEIASRDDELDETRRDAAVLEAKLEEAEHLVAATVERVDSLKAELANKNTLAREATQSIEMLEAKLSIADSNAVAAEKTIGDLEQELTAVEGQKEEILEGLEESAAQIDELYQQIKSKETELSATKQALEIEKAENKGQHKILVESLQQSANRVSELQILSKHKDTEITDLTEKLSKSEDDYNSLKKFMERGTQQIEDLQAEVDTKNGEITALKQKYVASEDERKGIETAFKQLEQKYEDCVESLEQSSKETVDNAAKMRALLNLKETELKDMRKKLDTAESIADEAHEYQSIIEELEEKIELCEKMITERETRISSLEETVEEQEEQMQKHCDRITASAREMQTVLEDASTRQNTLEKALTDLDAELQESNSMNEEHEATIKKMEGLFQEYEEKLTSAGNAIESQKKTFEDQIELLNKVNTDMESIHQSLQGDVAEKEGQLAASQHKITELEETIVKLTNRVSEKTDEIERIKTEESAKNNKTIAEMTAQLEIAAKKLADGNVDTGAVKVELMEKEEALLKVEAERDALLKDIARIAEDKATAETDYKRLEEMVEMCNTTMENAEMISKEKIKSLEEQLLDVERTHADAEADLNQALGDKKSLEARMLEMKANMETKIGNLKADLGDKEEEIKRAKNMIAAMEPVTNSEQYVDSSIDGDLIAKNADLSQKVHAKDEELENMRVCLDYLKERLTLSNDKNEKLKKEMRHMTQRNSVLESELQAREIFSSNRYTNDLDQPNSATTIKQERQQIENAALMKYAAQRDRQEKENSERIDYEEDADPRC